VGFPFSDHDAAGVCVAKPGELSGTYLGDSCQPSYCHRSVSGVSLAALQPVTRPNRLRWALLMLTSLFRKNGMVVRLRYAMRPPQICSSIWTLPLAESL